VVKFGAPKTRSSRHVIPIRFLLREALELHIDEAQHIRRPTVFAFLGVLADPRSSEDRTLFPGDQNPALNHWRPLPAVLMFLGFDEFNLKASVLCRPFDRLQLPTQHFQGFF